MLVSRRHVMAGLGVLALAACAPDPVVQGEHVQAPIPPEPSQGPGIAELCQAVAGLSAAIRLQEDPYKNAALAQTAAWQERLLAADPLTGGDAEFPEPTASPPATDLSQASDVVVSAATQAVQLAETQPMRLLLTAIVLGATGLATTSSEPGATAASPTDYPDITTLTAQGVALTYAWALIQALEKGLGVLASDDETYEPTSIRLAEVKTLRNRLIAALGQDRPAQDIHYEQPAITDAATLLAARAALELKLLNALASVVAAGAMEWLTDAIAQVPKVQAAGGQLPTWPGWASS